MAQADPMSGMIPEIISSSAPKDAAEIFKAPHGLGVRFRVIGEDRAEQEPAQMQHSQQSWQAPFHRP